MEQLLVRNVDERLKHNIKKAAKRNGRSMQAEVLDTLERAYGTESEGNLLDIITQMREDLNGDEFPLPERSQPRPALELG